MAKFGRRRWAISSTTATTSATTARMASIELLRLHRGLRLEARDPLALRIHILILSGFVDHLLGLRELAQRVAAAARVGLAVRE